MYDASIALTMREARAGPCCATGCWPTSRTAGVSWMLAELQVGRGRRRPVAVDVHVWFAVVLAHADEAEAPMLGPAKAVDGAGLAAAQRRAIPSSSGSVCGSLVIEESSHALSRSM